MKKIKTIALNYLTNVNIVEAVIKFDFQQNFIKRPI